MKPDFDYSTVPYNFIHCPNGQCQHAATCLRNLVMPYIPSECECYVIVNPARTVPKGNGCPYYMPDKLHRFALGITHLLDNVPHNDAIILKQQIMACLNRATYYRCWRKERLIKPDEQERIRQLFLNRGIKEAPQYDEYVEQYEW